MAQNTMMNMTILATGSALPKKAWSNEALIKAKGLDSNDTWIQERTGIKQRYMVGEGESTFTLAKDAVVQALKRAKVKPADVGVLVVATCTPDLTFPSVAALVHGALALPRDAAVLDINAACSGFIHALAVAQGLLSGNKRKYAVVVGAETFSNVVDWKDRGTCVLFGDGAGAVVLKKENAKTAKGLLAIELGADGSSADLLKSSGGVAQTRTAGVVLMNGKEVFRHAVRQMGELPKVLAKAKLKLKDVDWVVPHQANLRIIEAAAKNLGVPMKQVIVTVDQHANTSAASIPLALDWAVQKGKIRRGNVVLLQAFGAGFAWSSAVIKY